jgi:hypothetical protein
MEGSNKRQKTEDVNQTDDKHTIVILIKESKPESKTIKVYFGVTQTGREDTFFNEMQSRHYARLRLDYSAIIPSKDEAHNVRDDILEKFETHKSQVSNRWCFIPKTEYEEWSQKMSSESTNSNTEQPPNNMIESVEQTQQLDTEDIEYVAVDQPTSNSTVVDQPTSNVINTAAPLPIRPQYPIPIRSHTPTNLELLLDLVVLCFTYKYYF